MYLFLNQVLQNSSHCLVATPSVRTNSAGYLFLSQAIAEPDNE
jgi:hypothetical protein